MSYYQILRKILTDFRLFIGTYKFIFLIFIGFISVFLGAIEPLFSAKVIDILQKYIQTNEIDFNFIIYFFIGWGIFILINSFLRFYYRYNLVDVNLLKFFTYIIINYKNKILDINQASYLEKKPASLFKSIDRGTDGILQVSFSIFLDLFVAIFGILLSSIILITINIKLFLVLYLMMPFVILLGYYFNLKTKQKQSILHKKWNNFFGDLGNYITNLTLVKTLSIQQNIKSRLSKDIYSTLNEQIQISKRWGIADIYIQFIINISRFLVLLFGVFLIKSGEITFAVLFLFFTYIGYIYYPVGVIFSNFRKLQTQFEAINNMYETLNSISYEENNKGLFLDKIDGNIEFKKINFSYIKGQKVLSGIDFKINKGEKIALVGSTGSGKSTIVNLFLKFWENYSGEIILDGKDIKEINTDFLRKNIGIVLQDSSLFNDTILNNLKYANPDATFDEIKISLKKAKAEFVFDLKDGINTIIGERGLKLSGGEKQRLSIARIFLKNPEILIFDEATSALDNKTEIEIQSSIEELLKNKTSIIIAHRLSTIKKVDKIFVMNKGKIIETGTYEELINAGGYFYKLANPDKLIIT